MEPISLTVGSRQPMHSLSNSLFLSLLLFVISFSTSAAPAPPLSLNTDAGQVKLENYKGKVVYLDFWASWCVPCRKSFPWMNEMQARYGKSGLVILAVNLDKDKTNIGRFLKKYPANFTIAYDPEGKAAEKFKVMGMPSSNLIDRQGNIVKTHVGFRARDKKELEDQIRAALRSK